MQHEYQDLEATRAICRFHRCDIILISGSERNVFVLFIFPLMDCCFLWWARLKELLRAVQQRNESFG